MPTGRPTFTPINIELTGLKKKIEEMLEVLRGRALLASTDESSSCRPAAVTPDVTGTLRNAHSDSGVVGALWAHADSSSVTKPDIL
jgi:hypothetical protein